VNGVINITTKSAKDTQGTLIPAWRCLLPDFARPGSFALLVVMLITPFTAFAPHSVPPVR